MFLVLFSAFSSHFEFTHEIARNVLKDYFEYQGTTSITGSRDASREAFNKGLISSGCDLFRWQFRSSFFFQLFAVSLIANCSSSPSTPADLSKPQGITIHTEDIPRFWKAFDASENKVEPEQVQIFDEYYFNPASKGLKDFYALRIEDTKSFVNYVNQTRAYYSAICGHKRSFVFSYW
jgi:hypothetical protein